MEKDLNKIKLLTGKTAEEYLQTRPERYRSVETEAIFKCLNQNLPLIDGMIQETARGIIRGERKNNLRITKLRWPPIDCGTPKKRS